MSIQRRVDRPVLISVGTRPEIIKMAPVYAELRRRKVPVAWAHTGQHREMAETLYRFFDIQPEYELTLERGNGSLAQLTSTLMQGLSALYEQLQPRAVLVHGDTTSTLASALTAFYLGAPVGHVEAGLRTFDPREPFPEEKNREIAARLARWHFAPTSGAAANLLREGIADSAVFMVGNTAVDAAQAGADRLEQLLGEGKAVLPPEIEALRGRPGHLHLITVTAHRRENWGDGIRSTARAVAALLSTHPDLAVVWPVHGNPAVSQTVHEELGPLARSLAGRLTLCAPLDYPAMLWCLRRSVLALTDSGGIQEEGAAMSTPVLVLRNATERPELISAGAGMLVGTNTARIVEVVSSLLADAPALKRMRAAVNPFGDGATSVRVADILQRDLGL